MARANTHRNDPTSEPQLSYRGFVSEVAAELGASEHDAARAIKATLFALGVRLPPSDAAALASRLPSELGCELLSCSPAEVSARCDDLREFEREIVESSHGTVELRHCRAVCQVLAAHLDEQARSHLRMQPLTSLFRPSA
jgi:uncharacterized protein (DUF2267 family)